MQIWQAVAPGSLHQLKLPDHSLKYQQILHPGQMNPKRAGQELHSGRDLTGGLISGEHIDFDFSQRFYHRDFTPQAVR